MQVRWASLIASTEWLTRFAVVSPIRAVATDDPETKVSDIDLACGVGALAASMDAPAYPGSAVNFTWVSGSGGNVRTLYVASVWLAELMHIRSGRTRWGQS